MKSLYKALAAVTTLVALSAHAEGLYLGGGLGTSHYKGGNVGGAPTDRSDTGLKLYGGYSVLPNLAVETGYANLGKFKSAAGDLSASGVFVDAVGSLPLGAGFSALGSVGLLSGKLKNNVGGSDSGMSYKFGGGVQYELAKNIGLRGEWERYHFDALNTKASTDMLSLGANYRF